MGHYRLVREVEHDECQHEEREDVRRQCEIAQVESDLCRVVRRRKESEGDASRDRVFLEGRKMVVHLILDDIQHERDDTEQSRAEDGYLNSP